jgi:hypothetical protein
MVTSSFCVEDDLRKRPRIVFDLGQTPKITARADKKEEGEA